ncbi:hypothetical protein [Phocaeicola plebeius]|uniref:hypothetical protein n=1 Tax=Phocaeicola plebeius TaxID=310297 RepID=UPI003AF0D305
MRGETNEKQSFSGLAIPNRILSYGKIVKGERRDKRKRSFSGLAIPNRILSYGKIVKGERRDKRKTKFFRFGYPEPYPVLWKDSER